MVEKQLGVEQPHISSMFGASGVEMKGLCRLRERYKAATLALGCWMMAWNGLEVHSTREQEQVSHRARRKGAVGTAGVWVCFFYEIWELFY